MVCPLQDKTIDLHAGANRRIYVLEMLNVREQPPEHINLGKLPLSPVTLDIAFIPLNRCGSDDTLDLVRRAHSLRELRHTSPIEPSRALGSHKRRYV